MTSTRKSAAVWSLSPAISPLAPQEHRAPRLAQEATKDPQWEARFKEAVRQAILTLGAPKTQVSPHPHPLQQPAAPLPLSVAALEEAEAAHIAQGLRLHEAHRAQEQLAAEMAGSEAEQARLEAEAFRALQEQLQYQLQALATANT